MAHYIFYVTVVAGKYQLDHYDEQDVQLGHDLTYRFDQSDASNASHQIGFSSTDPSGSATAYTTGVTVTGTAGSAGAYTEIAVTSGTTTPLWYYDSVGAATGGQITTTAAEFVATGNLGLRRPILGNSTETWGNYINQSFDVIESIVSSALPLSGAATVNSTNLEVTNIKAKDGTSAGSIADSTGVVTLASSVLTTADINGGAIDGTDITVGVGKTLDVSAGTLTTSAAQKQTIVDGATITASDVGLGNVTNESKATMFTDPVFTGTTITAPNDSISGDVINGGTISDFASTGIDDNASSTALTIDSSGNVGIGTGSPGNKFVIAGTLGNVEYEPSGAVINFTRNSANYINATAALGYLIFSTGGTETLRIDSSGNLKFNSGYGFAATAYGCRAWVNFNGAFSDSSGQSGTYSCSASTITITDTAHGLEVGDSIHAVFTRSAGDSVTITDDFFTVLTVPSADTFTIQTVVGTTDQSGTVSYDSDAATATAGSGPIRASGNVSSITDNGTGDYTVNFTTAMPDANYSASGLCTSEGSTGNPQHITPNSGGTKTTTQYRFTTLSGAQSTGAAYDATRIDMQFFR